MTWASARNLLCVRLDSLGDVLMTTPALRALKESVPGRRITLLTSPSGAVAARYVPEIDAAIEFGAPWMKASGANPARDSALLRKLSARKFDGAVIFTVFSQNPLPTAYLCYLAGIPLRAAHCHENPYDLLTDWVPDPEPATIVRHEVRRQLDLVQAIGGCTANENLSFAVPAAARQRVQRVLRHMGLDFARPLVLAHPGATAASRRYPPEHFAAALTLLVRQTGCQVVLTGDAHEAALLTGIQSAMGAPSHSAAGLFDLGELGAAIELADVLISNNTGPAHIAAALGTRVVDLYALTNPQHTPWQVESRVLFHDVPCRYCYKSVCPAGHNDCLRRVEPETVAAAALELLESAGVVLSLSLRGEASAVEQKSGLEQKRGSRSAALPGMVTLER
jgi:lipopolysaccharide heptosyltransferase II